MADKKENIKVFVLTETDSTDPKWSYNEAFSTRAKARKRLKELYHEDVVEREDLVVKSAFNADDAWAEMVDDVVIAWHIKECDVQ